MTVDIHSHLLPAVDDGAPDLKTSCRLLSSLAENGVTHLALTPHFYPYSQSLERFLNKRNAAFEKLLTLPEAKKFSFSLGAEVYLSSTLFNTRDLSLLCYKDTNYMLVEPKYEKMFSKETEIRLRRLIADYGITPVIAHIDRYPFLVSDEKLLNKLKTNGCMFQANFSSFSSCFSRRRLISLYRKGYIDFLGEDIHEECFSLEKRRIILNKIQKKEASLLPFVNENGKKLLFPRKVHSQVEEEAAFGQTI